MQRICLSVKFHIGENPSNERTRINYIVKEMINTHSICLNLPKEPFTINNNNNNNNALFNTEGQY